MTILRKICAGTGGALKCLMALCIISTVSACGVIGDQTRAGIFKVTMEACEGQTVETGVCKYEVIDGKEYSNASFEVDWDDATGMSYSAEGAKAFEGQRIRGDVEKAAVKAFGDVAPAALDVFLKALGFAPIAAPVAAPDPEGPD